LDAGVKGPNRIRFRFKPYRRAFAVPVRTSRGVWAVREGIVIRLEREDGAAALGEIAPIESFGTETFAGALAWCAAMGEQPEPERLASVPGGMPCCAAAVAAARAGLERTGGDSDGVRPAGRAVCALLPAGEDAGEALTRAADAGFRCFKIKIGAADFEAERDAIDRLVERMPPAARLRLDANGGLLPRQAARWVRAAEPWPVEYIEQPFPAAAAADTLALARDSAVPLALDEAVRSAGDVRRWCDLGWTGLFVIKPGLAGDPRALLGEAASAPERFVFSSALETAVGMAAGLRLAFAAGGTRALGYGVAAFFGGDGLGGGLARAWISPSDLADVDAEAVWNRL
jgi:O-succinylbenzoate synthase